MSTSRLEGSTTRLSDRRALVKGQTLRASSTLSPLYPAQYESFSRSLAVSLRSGEYLQDVKPKEEAEQNPFEMANMDGMMDGMKKQAVMM